MYFYNKNYDCIKLTISALLKNNDINLFDLWPQFGIYMVKKERLFSPYSLSTENQLKHFNNIDVNYYYPKNEIEFKNKINDFFSKKESLIIVVDTYTLPCNAYFNDKHNLHYVELRRNADSYKIIDHYYKDTMFVSFKTLCNILNNSYQFGISEKLEFIDINDINSYLQMNKNEIIYEQIKNLKSQIVHFDLYNIFINYIIEKCDDLELNIDEIHATLKEFGQSRYHAANFIQNSNISIKEEMYTLLSKNSNIFFNVANIILKYHIKQKQIPKNTLSKMLNEIHENEQQIIEIGDLYYENR